MNTLHTDARIFPQDDPITFRSDEMIFYELSISGNRANNIEHMVKGNYYFVGKKTEKVEFSVGIQIYDMGGNCFVIEYAEQETRDTDMQLLK